MIRLAQACITYVCTWCMYITYACWYLQNVQYVLYACIQACMWKTIHELNIHVHVSVHTYLLYIGTVTCLYRKAQKLDMTTKSIKNGFDGLEYIKYVCGAHHASQQMPTKHTCSTYCTWVLHMYVYGYRLHHTQNWCGPNSLFQFELVYVVEELSLP